MSQLKTLTIKRFKKLKSLELDIGETTVLIGTNNAGKSSILQALHFAVSVAQTASLIGDNVNWADDKFRLSFNPSQLIYSPVSDVLSLGFNGELQEPAADQIEIRLVCEDETECSVAVRRGRNRNIAVTITGRALGIRLMNMEEPFTVYAPGLAGIPKEERYMSPGAVRRMVARGDANLALRNVLLMIFKLQRSERQAYDYRVAKARVIRVKQQEADDALLVAAAMKLAEETQSLYKKPRFPVRPPSPDELEQWDEGTWGMFHRRMALLFPGVAFDIVFNEDRDENIEVLVKLNGGLRLPLDSAGTSFLQASQILAYISLFEPAVLILDEPDSHLHPNNQRALCNAVTEIASTARKPFRVLISTHSRHVLDALKDNSIILWINNGTIVEYDSVSTVANLMALGALDSIDYFVGDRIRCLFATEDSNADSLKALRALLGANGFVMADTDIRSYAGCTKVDSATVLRQFLQEKAPAVKFVVHRDRDYMEGAEAGAFEDRIRKIDAFPFITELNDAECYFINADHLAALNEGLSVARAQELIDEATKQSEQASKEVLATIRIDAAFKAKGANFKKGEVAYQAFADYDADPKTWRRGKLTLNLLRQLLHTELKKAPLVLAESPHLSTAALRAIRDSIWSAVPATSKT